MNQAMGRIIRNKDDYGVILNIDERNSYSNIKCNFSGWLNEKNPNSVKYYYSIEEKNNLKKNDFLDSIKQFYELMQNK